MALHDTEDDYLTPDSIPERVGLRTPPFGAVDSRLAEPANRMSQPDGPSAHEVSSESKWCGTFHARIDRK